MLSAHITAESILLLVGHSTLKFIFPCIGQQIPNNIHVSHVTPRPPFFLRKRPFWDAKHTFWHQSLPLFSLTPSDWHPNHPLRFLSTHWRKSYFLISVGWCKYKFSHCTTLRLQGLKRAAPWRAHNKNKCVRTISVEQYPHRKQFQKLCINAENCYQ